MYYVNKDNRNRHAIVNMEKPKWRYLTKKKKRTTVNYGNARVGEIFLPREDHTNSVSTTKHLSLKIYMQVTSGRMSRFYLYI